MKRLFFDSNGRLQGQNMRPQATIPASLIEPMEPDSRGYELVEGAKVYRKGDRFIVTFWPDETKDPWHNCDDEGCGQDHVLARFTAPSLDEGPL